MKLFAGRSIPHDSSAGAHLRHRRADPSNHVITVGAISNGAVTPIGHETIFVFAFWRTCLGVDANLASRGRIPTNGCAFKFPGENTFAVRRETVSRRCRFLDAANLLAAVGVQDDPTKSTKSVE